MNMLNATDSYVVENVLVPVSLLLDPHGFGGTQISDCLAGDLIIRGGQAVCLRPNTAPSHPSGLITPRLTECHVHLDKCHTISRMGRIGGDLNAAMDAQRRDRMFWTEDDLRQRAERGLQELMSSGCGIVRSHFDWAADPESTSPPLAWSVLQELAVDYQDTVHLQVASLLNTTDLADPAKANAIGREIARGNGVLGLFVLNQPDRHAAIQVAVQLAEKHGLALDFHVDEGLHQGLDGLEIIADTLIETGFQGPVLCGHACSLINVAGEPLQALLGKIARAGLTIASLPTSNLYLQGRSTGTPDRRGITRIGELRTAGVPVVVGTDNVRDAFCPLGRHDPRKSLELAALTAHLDPPFGDLLPMITTNAQTALGLSPTTVDGAAVEDLLIFDAASTSDWLTGTSAPKPLKHALTGEIA
ncbi:MULTISPECIES: amidohydrolase family protein [unclassified Ruegeria]|uniref:amidohydrolase family protein n=1 Tax=unclassified Ruegeria TaxID=2625375 RepID=UPI0020A02A7B|nr:MULTISPECIES: amidohydrolase family protein [unclassified Ruegeria]